MELWVRSQDKMKLVSNCNLYISTEMKNEYIVEDLNNKYLKLGTYKSKERALEILDEIQERIIELDKAVIYSHISEEDYLNVYEMPEE